MSSGPVKRERSEADNLLPPTKPAPGDTFSFGFGDEEESGNTPDASTSRLEHIPNLDKLSQFKSYHLKYAVIAESIFNLYGIVAQQGQLVEINWLDSTFFDFTCRIVAHKDTPHLPLNVCTLESHLAIEDLVIYQPGLVPQSANGAVSDLLPTSSQIFCLKTNLLIIPSSQHYLITGSHPQQAHHTDSMTDQNSGEAHSSSTERQPAKTRRVFEIHPAFNLLSHPTTAERSYERHFCPSPLVLDNSLASWCWPVTTDFFIQKIYQQSCFVIHGCGDRLHEIKKDLFDFDVHKLLLNSSNSIIWMKTLPLYTDPLGRTITWNPNNSTTASSEKSSGVSSQKPTTNLPFDVDYKRQMNYIQSNPEISYSAYLSGHTIYFNPSFDIQQKYVKSLSSDLLHNFGCSRESVDGIGGDMEIFAVKTRHQTDWHFDAQDNISIQLVGTKKWSVISSIQNPLTNYHPGSTNRRNVMVDKYTHAMSNESLLNHEPAPDATSGDLTATVAGIDLDNHPDKEVFIVQPGSVFYHPAGTWHKVEALDDDGSLSINISLDSLRYGELLLSRLTPLIHSHPLMRQRVAIGPTNNTPKHPLLSTDSAWYQQSQYLDQLLDIIPSIVKSVQGSDVLLPALLSEHRIDDSDSLKRLGIPDGRSTSNQSSALPAQAASYTNTQLLNYAYQSIRLKDYGCLLPHKHDFIYQYFPWFSRISNSVVEDNPRKLSLPPTFPMPVQLNPTVRVVSNDIATIYRSGETTNTLGVSKSIATASEGKLPPAVIEYITSLQMKDVSSYNLFPLGNILYYSTLVKKDHAPLYHLFSICTGSGNGQDANSGSLPPSFSLGVIFDRTEPPEILNSLGLNHLVSDIVSYIDIQLFLWYAAIKRVEFPTLDSLLTAVIDWCYVIHQIQIAEVNKAQGQEEEAPLSREQFTSDVFYYVLCCALHTLSIFIHCGIVRPLVHPQ